MSRAVVYEVIQPLSKRSPSRGISLAGASVLLFSLVACGGGGGGSYGGGSSSNPPPAPTYQITNLVSDQATAGAATTDTHLVNPWGLAYGPGTDFWLANQATGTTTAYNGAGATPAVPLVVSVPVIPGMAMGGPTGVVFNGTTGFQADEFITASLDGGICGWSAGSVMTHRFGTSSSTAVYTGLALATNGTATYLFAANLNAGTVDVFDSTYAPINLGASAFVDPSLPAGFSPYNIQALAGKLYVTYAKHDPAALRETPGAGLGYVSIFNPDGSFVRRVASGGSLNAPWGVALAPATFGTFANALLVGNFGDGHITAFDSTTGAQLGQLSGASGAPLVINGLWAMAFGNDASAGLSNQLYVTAGTLAENHGLFATISYGSTGSGGGTGGGLGY
jgi:uncharacterized protein (TIGR03118 family)